MVITPGWRCVYSHGFMNLTTNHHTEVHFGFPTFITCRCFSRFETLIFSRNDILGLTFVLIERHFFNAGNVAVSLETRLFHSFLASVLTDFPEGGVGCTCRETG